MWDRETGKPVYNAIVWQCCRTAELCEQKMCIRDRRMIIFTFEHFYIVLRGQERYYPALFAEPVLDVYKRQRK